MSDEPTPNTGATQQAGSGSTPPDEPFVYPTIGTEWIIEKSESPGRIETRSIGEDGSRD